MKEDGELLDRNKQTGKVWGRETGEKQWGQRGIRTKNADTKYEHVTVKPACYLKNTNNTK